MLNTLGLILIIGIVEALIALLTFYVTVYTVTDYLTGDFWEELTGKKKND